MVSSSIPRPSQSSESVSFAKSWLVWACAALFFCYQFIMRVSPGVMANDLMASFKIDACTLGFISGFYYYAYSSFQVPGGALLDKFKPRRVITIAILVCSLGTLLFSMAESIYIAALGRALIGGGSALGFLGCFKISSLWFPAHRLPIIVGFTLTAGTIGATTAGYPLAWLLDIYGWRHTLGLFSFLGFVLTAIAWLIIRDTPPPALEKEVLKSHGDSHRHVPTGTLLGSVKEVLRKPQSWLIAFYGFLMYIPLSAFTDIWGPPFLMAQYNLDKTTAGTINSAIYIGLGIGSPAFSFLCNKLKAYKPAVFISAFASLVLFSIVFYMPLMPLWLLTSCLILAGFALGGQFLAFSMASAINPLSATGTAGGFQNMICMLSGVLFQPLLGWMLDYSWKGDFVNGVRAYTASEYIFAFTPIVIALVLACLVIIPIEEKY